MSSISQEKLLVAFDLDGTLVDTRLTVLEAYRQAGITMPKDAWGLTWDEWLPKHVGSDIVAKRMHEKKTAAYLNLIRAGFVEVLPPASLAADLMKDQAIQVGILTGASSVTSQALLARLSLTHNVVMGFGLTRANKLEAMQLDEWSYVVYIDDDLKMIELFDLELSPSRARAIHYTDQDAEQLTAVLNAHLGDFGWTR